MTDMLESYIKGVRLQSVYAEVGKLYNETKQDKAEKTSSGICLSGWQGSR